MNTIPNFITKFQDIITRFQMWRSAFLLRKDYNHPSMLEFTAVDSENFLDYN